AADQDGLQLLHLLPHFGAAPLRLLATAVGVRVPDRLQLPLLLLPGLGLGSGPALLLHQLGTLQLLAGLGRAGLGRRPTGGLRRTSALSPSDPARRLRPARPTSPTGRHSTSHNSPPVPLSKWTMCPRVTGRYQWRRIPSTLHSDWPPLA